MQLKESRTETLKLRGLDINVRHWGRDDSPAVFFIHGWMDASPTFQFLVDELIHDWHVIAPDLRGYGLSEWIDRAYWYPDYYADIEAIFDHYSPAEPVRIVGHSMGASISSVYAGVRSDRVKQLVMLDFLGLKPDPLVLAPKQLAAWLDNAMDPPHAKRYPSIGSLGEKLMSMNHRLTKERARFLAESMNRRLEDGSYIFAFDPWHRVPAPFIYRIEDSMAAWRQIKARVLLVISDDGFVVSRFGSSGEDFERLACCFTHFQSSVISNSGHNIQHDQPKELAHVIEAFLGSDSR